MYIPVSLTAAILSMFDDVHIMKIFLNGSRHELQFEYIFDIWTMFILDTIIYEIGCHFALIFTVFPIVGFCMILNIFKGWFDELSSTSIARVTILSRFMGSLNWLDQSIVILFLFLGFLILKFPRKETSKYIS